MPFSSSVPPCTFTATGGREPSFSANNWPRADTGVVTLIQRFGSAANLNIHLHCLVLDGVYLNCDGAAIFHEAAAPSTDELVLWGVRSLLLILLKNPKNASTRSA
jgi:hypothetical protein